MASPRDPARSKQNAPIAESGSAFDDEPEVTALIEDDEPEVTGHLLEVIEFLPDLPDLADLPPIDLAELPPADLAELAPVDPSEPPPVVKGLVAKRRPPRSVRPRRGRPRSADAERKILHAATQILEVKGVGGLSIEEVASKAAVGKTTIYRRWSSRGTLALDAFLAVFDGQQAPPDTGTFSGDLQVAFGQWVKALSGTSAGIMLVGLIAELQQDRTLAGKWQDQVVAPLRAQFSIMLDQAISRGEIPVDTDASVVLDLVFGACYYRLLHGHRPLNEQFVRQVVDVITRGVEARPELVIIQAIPIPPPQPAPEGSQSGAD